MRFHEFNIKESSFIDTFKSISDFFTGTPADDNTGSQSDLSIKSQTSVEPSSPVAQTSTPTSPVNVGKVKANQLRSNEISSYLKSKGLDRNQILGMLANIAGESGFNSGAYHIDSNGLPSGGLFQHNGPRFEKMVKSTGSDWSTDWQGQIDYALSEPEGRQYMNTKFSSPEKAVEWWVINFERPKYAQSDINKRIQLLKNFG